MMYCQSEFLRPFEDNAHSILRWCIWPWKIGIWGETCFHWLWKESVTFWCTLKEMISIDHVVTNSTFLVPYSYNPKYVSMTICPLNKRQKSIHTTEEDFSTFWYRISNYHFIYFMMLSWYGTKISILSQTTWPKFPLYYKRLSNKQAEEWGKGHTWLSEDCCIFHVNVNEVYSYFLSSVTPSRTL